MPRRNGRGPLRGGTGMGWPRGRCVLPMTPQEEILFMEINQDWEQGLGLRRGNRHGLTPDMKTAPINGWGRGFGAGRGMGGRR